MRKRITGFSNPTVKYLRSLRDKKHRKLSGQFLVEGLRLLEDARAGGRLPRLLTMAEERDHHPLLARLESDVTAAGGEVIETTRDILSKITGKSNTQSVVGVFDAWETSLALFNQTTRKSGSWRRTCAIPAISAPCCAPAMLSAQVV